MLRITAYIAWSLESTGYQGPAVEKARQFIEAHIGERAKPDAYTLAVLANFAADYAKDREFTNRAMQMLLDARTEKGDRHGGPRRRPACTAPARAPRWKPPASPCRRC